MFNRSTSHWLRIAAICMSLTALIPLGACGSSSDDTGSDAAVSSLRFTRNDSSVPPEFHTSDRIELADGLLTRTSFAEYEDVTVSEESGELSAAQLEELRQVVADADLAEIDLVEDDCDGVSIVTVRVEWEDGEELSGRMDSRTFGGEPGRCQSRSLEGDLAAVVSHLWDIDLQGS